MNEFQRFQSVNIQNIIAKMDKLHLSVPKSLQHYHAHVHNDVCERELPKIEIGDYIFGARSNFMDDENLYLQ